MTSNDQIVASIKQIVLRHVPDARVLLFGSRARNAGTPESDWDILVLTKEAIPKKLKKTIHAEIFPLSVEVGSFINVLVLQETEWLNNPSYYSLRENISAEVVPA